MILRAYRQEDLRDILTLFYETVHTVNRADYSPEQLDAWAPFTPDSAGWQNRLLKNRTIVAEQDGKPVGFADMDTGGYLDCLFVHRDFQRRGIAAALVSALEAEVLQNGGSVVRTEASLTARPFFLSRGYRVVREQHKPHNGCVFINFIMEKHLTQ